MAVSARRAAVRIVLGVGGPSGAGKSLVASMLQEYDPDNTIVIAEDSYCHDCSHVPWPARAQENMDQPAAIEHSLLIEHVRLLRSNRAVSVPSYDHSTFSRLPVTRLVAPRAIVIVEGILVLHNPALRSLFDVSIYVDAPPDICLCRRLLRDEASRSLPMRHTVETYLRTVRPMCQQYVIPSRDGADAVIINDGPLASLREQVSRCRAAWLGCAAELAP